MQMKSGVTISTLGHAILLAWGLLSFSARPFDAATAESLPVDIISATDFSQMTAGVKTAPKAEAPKPVVEKVADDPKPVKNPEAKVSEKPEIEAQKDDAPPPAPQVQPEKKPPLDEKKLDEKIAEALKKEQVKPPPAPKSTKVVSLLDALRESAGKGAPKRPARGKTPARKAAPRRKAG